MIQHKPSAGVITPLHRSDWNTRRLKFLLTRLTRPTKADDGIVTAFRDGVVTLRSNRREDGFTMADKEIGYQGVEPGDLVIHAMDGFAGAIGVSDSRGKCSPVYTIAVPKDRSLVGSERFWAYYLRNLATTGFIQSLAKGIRERSTDFRWSDASNLLVNFPSCEEQQAIANFLDHETALINGLIQKHELFLRAVAEKKASLVEQAITGELLLGTGGAFSTREDWFGTVPSDWPVHRAKFLFRERQDRSLDGMEELLSVSHLNGVTKRSEKEVYMFLAESNEGYKLVQEGDVVINTMWAWMGAMGVSSLRGLISPSYGVYRPIVPAYEAQYLDLLLRSRSFIAEVTRRSKGIHSSRLRLYPNAFLDIPLPAPPKAAQRSIVSAFQAATKREERLADLSSAAIDRLRELRSSLITAAVAGQIDYDSWRRRRETERRIEGVEEGVSA